MPRKVNEKSIANLIKNSDLTPKERQEKARKAGKASGEARAVYKSLNKDLREQCTPEKVARMNARLIAMAERGNIKAYELVRDGLGEKPSDNLKVVAEVDNPYDELSVEELKALAKKCEKDEKAESKAD